MIERTLVLLKPDAVQRSVCGELISRFEKAGLKIVGLKMVWADEELSKKHYKAHIEKSFYKGLEEMIIEGPVVAIVLEGVDAVPVVRKIVGATEPKQALPGTIRGDYAHVSIEHANSKGRCVRNLIHASGNYDEAKEEINLWFSPKELHTYKTANEVHMV